MHFGRKIFFPRWAIVVTLCFHFRRATTSPSDSQNLGLLKLIFTSRVGAKTSGYGVSILMYYEAVCGASLVLHIILAFS